MKNAVLFLMLIFLQSCIRTEEIGTPWLTDIKPVVYSVLSTDRVPGVYLGKTYHPDNKMDSLPYPNAKVFMAEENKNWVEFFRKDATSQYFVDKKGEIKPAKGKKYRLKIEIDDLLVEAETQIPAQVATIQSAECKLAEQDSHTTYGMNGITVLYSTLKAKLSLPQQTESLYILQDNYFGYDGSTFLKSTDYMKKDFFVPKDTLSFDLKVMTVAPEFKKYILARQLEYSFDDEFLPEILMGTFSGVLPDYNNIRGGIGLFTAYWEEHFWVQVQQ
jgi:hypothetical protein